MPVEQYLRAREGEKPLGVYALYDAHRDLQYVGYARNMPLAVKARLHPCAWARPCCATIAAAAAKSAEACSYLYTATGCKVLLLQEAHACRCTTLGLLAV